MKDIAFIIVLVLAGLLLLFLSSLQAASKSLKLGLIFSILMGGVLSFIVAMVAFTVDTTLEFDAIYKIMLLSQLASAMFSVMLQMQPCF